MTQLREGARKLSVIKGSPQAPQLLDPQASPARCLYAFPFHVLGHLLPGSPRTILHGLPASSLRAPPREGGLLKFNVLLARTEGKGCSRINQWYLLHLLTYSPPKYTLNRV